MKPYKVLCNSLLESKEFRSFFTGSKTLFRDNASALMNEIHLVYFFGFTVLEQASFPCFLSFRALVFAKGDNLD
jgi:hypothetical protein